MLAGDQGGTVMVGKARYARAMTNLGREINGDGALLLPSPRGQMRDFESWLLSADDDALISAAASLAAAAFRIKGPRLRSWEEDVRMHVGICTELTGAEIANRGLSNPVE